MWLSRRRWKLIEWTQPELESAAACILLYKEIRHIIQFGDQFRLISSQKNDYSAVQYVSKDKSEGVLFVFRTHIPDPFNTPMIYLQGLDPETLYSIEGFDQPRSGFAWMNSGLKIELKNLQSKVLKIKRIAS
ncbi:MAG: GH36 C-terminal domain-containing protein [Anaerolineales bacterium]